MRVPKMEFHVVIDRPPRERVIFHCHLLQGERRNVPEPGHLSEELAKSRLTPIPVAGCVNAYDDNFLGSSGGNQTRDKVRSESLQALTVPYHQLRSSSLSIVVELLNGERAPLIPLTPAALQRELQNSDVPRYDSHTCASECE